LATPPPRRALVEEAVIADALRAMGERGAEMVRTSMDMFDRRDVNAQQLLTSLDEVIDRENEKIADTLMSIETTDIELRQWATRMVFAGRWLERIGDHAVNIAERVTSMGPRPGQSLNVTGW
jgi:phosphate transport system protein